MISHLILVFAMATSAVAFEQIYAINAGGEKDHTDADGIFYTAKKGPRNFKWPDFDYYDVPRSIKDIYQSINYVHKTDTPNSMEYQIPLKSDGLYVLIAKFSFRGNVNNDIINLTLNKKIQLLSNVDQFQQCGGSEKICDEYFYFCVSDKTIYYKEQSSPILNEIIHIELLPLKDEAYIAGLVLLKGTLGERKKLKSSATTEPMFFNPLNTNNRCTVAENVQMILEEQRQSTDKLEKSLATLSETIAKTYTESKSVKDLQKQQNSNFIQLQSTMNQFAEISLQNISNLNAAIQSSFKGVQVTSEKQSNSLVQLQKSIEHSNKISLTNISNLNVIIQSSFENTQAAIVREIQSLQKQQITNFESVEQRITKNMDIQIEASLKNFTELLNHQISNISFEMKSTVEEINRSNVNNLKNISNQVQVKSETTQVAIRNLEKQQNYRADQLHKSFESSSEISLTNISNLNAIIMSSLENTQVTIESFQKQQIANIESFEQRITKNMDIKIEASLKNFTELLSHQTSNIRFEMKSTVEEINRSNENNLKNISNQVQVTSENTQVAIKNLEKQQSDRSDQLQNSIQRSSEISLKAFEGVQVANDNIQSAVKNLHQQQSDTFNKLTNNNLNSIANLNAVIQSLFVNTQVTILREIQSLQKSQNEIVSRYESAEQRILKSLELKNEASLRNITDLVTSISSEMRASSQQTSNNKIETLQADVRQLAQEAKDSRKMQAEIQQKTEKMSLEISEIKEQLKDIKDAVMSFAESTR
jgi:hypothetical protein